MKTNQRSKNKQSKRSKLAAKKAARVATIKRKKKNAINFIEKGVAQLQKQREKLFFKEIKQKQLRYLMKNVPESDVDVIPKPLDIDSVLRDSKESNYNVSEEVTVDTLEPIKHIADPVNDILEPLKENEQSVEDVHNMAKEKHNLPMVEMECSSASFESTEHQEKADVEITDVNEDLNDVKSIDLTDKLDDDIWVISMNSDSSINIVAVKINHKVLRLFGCMKLTVLKGVCDLNGFKMMPGCSCDVYAPISHIAASLTILNDSSEDDNLVALTQKSGIELSSLPENFANHPALLLAESLKESSMSLPGYQTIFDLRSVQSSVKHMLCSTCCHCSTVRHFKTHGLYDQVLESLLTYCHKKEDKTHNFPITVSVGGKNVGKSNLNRYLVNCLLERYTHVYYFECDVGQTEFTPSGFVSIHKVDRGAPLVGPPFTHQRIPKYCCFYGNKSASGQPSRYVDCIQYVLNCLLDDLNGTLDAPLIVNTMGWVRDVGAMLLIDIIRTVSPTHILQFETSNKSLNHNNRLTKPYIATALGWIYKNPQHVESYELIVLKADFFVESKKKRLKASDHRTLSLLSHLQKIVHRCYSQQRISKQSNFLGHQLQSINPFRIQLSNLLVGNALERDIKYKHALAALNATCIALCTAPSEAVDQYKNISCDDYLPSPPVCSCVGIGVVRGVNPATNELYIITDLVLKELSKVNCIVVGDLVFPDVLYDKKDSTNSNPPYVSKSFSVKTFGSTKFKSRRQYHIKRIEANKSS